MAGIRITLYQTLKDLNNPDYVEANGPFPCRHNGAWLGHGYYFWDTHVQLGHWWGVLSHNGKYMICRAYGEMDELCWDLHGRGDHRMEFVRICEEIVAARLSTRESLMVPQVIEYFKKNKAFSYTSIRALGSNSVSWSLTDPHLVFRMRYIDKNNSVLDLYPPVQVCLIRKEALSLRRLKVIYPVEYNEQYA